MSFFWKRRGPLSLVAVFGVGAAYFFFHPVSADEDCSVRSVFEAGTNLDATKTQSTRVTEHAAIRHYCNYPLKEEPAISSKDLLDAGLTLRGISILTRHGNRAPITKFSDRLNAPFCSFSNEEEENLYRTYAEHVKGIGDSVQEVLPEPLKNFKRLNPNETCRVGHLTAKGLVQMLKLGQSVRRTYAAVWPTDDTDVDFYVYTTTFPRTYQSGRAFLYGLLGPERSAELSMMATDSIYFCTGSWCKCPKWSQYNTEMNLRASEYRQHHKEHVDKTVSHVNEVLQAQLKLGEPHLSVDQLMGYACHEEPFPCPSEDKCITEEMVHFLHDFLTGRYYATSQVSGVYKKCLLEALPVMVDWQKMIDTLNSGERGKRAFQYFSGHDVTIAPILNTLGVFDGMIPPYASNLRLEVFEKNEEKKFYVRFVYNGADVTSQVSFCEKSLTKTEGGMFLCDGARLTEFVRCYLDEHYKPTAEFNELCT